MAFPAWAGKVVDADRVRTIAGCVNVQWHGARGDGLIGSVAANDAAFAAARAAADLTNRGLYVPAGDYYFSDNAWLNVPLARVGMEISGDSGQTVLHYTGAGTEIVYYDGGGAPTVGAGLYGGYLHDLILVGIGTTLYGVRGRNFHQSRIVNVSVRDVTTAALFLETCVQNDIIDFACTVNRVFFAIQPTAGIYMTQRGGGVDPPGFTCSMNVVVNAQLEGLANGTGIVIDDAVDNLFMGCAPEGNEGGVFLGANALFNYFLRTEMVSNTAFDIDCAGAFNVFVDCLSQSLVTWQIGAKGNVLSQGLYSAAIANLSAFAQRLDGPTLTIAAVGAFADPLSPGLFWSNVDGAWHHRLPGLLVYADNVAALAGGLVAGDLYRTATGIVMTVF